VPQLTPSQIAQHRAWIEDAVRRVEADAQRSADTHLHQLPLPAMVGWAGIDLYLKDESVHPTGSLKHRLARSLFLYALCNGWLREGSTVVEASSGSTAVSEAYFARLIGLPFVAVMTASTSPEKIELIEWYGGRCHFVDSPGEVYDAARALAEETGGHYLDQFTYAERATDWRGNNNIAESIFGQMAQEPHPVPAWIVVSAGTGGTSATIGRYLRYKRLPTRLLVAGPEGSAFYQGWREDSCEPTAPGSRIEGIGRPRVEPSFVGGVVDDMVQVPDAASIATMRWVSTRLGRRVGPSTGTNVWAALGRISRMRADGESGSVVTLLCDSGERYLSSYYDDAWLAERGIDLGPWTAALAEFDASGTWPAG